MYLLSILEYMYLRSADLINERNSYFSHILRNTVILGLISVHRIRCGLSA